MTSITKSLALTSRSLLLFAAGAAIAVAALSPLAAIPQSAAQSKASATSASATALYVVPDLAERVAKFKLVHMPFNSQGLSAREKQMVDKLVDASGLLDCIYWRQSDPEGLETCICRWRTAKIRRMYCCARYLKINGSRFDLIDDDKPFVGTRADVAGPRLLFLRHGQGLDAGRDLNNLREASTRNKKPESTAPTPSFKRHPAQDWTNHCLPSESHAISRRVQGISGADGEGSARRRGAERRSGLREIPAAAGGCAADGRLLRERHRLARSGKSEIRCGVCALRGL